MDAVEADDDGAVNPQAKDPATNCVPATAGLVSWWRGEANMLDSWGSNNGTGREVSYGSGKVGRAFALPGAWRVTVPDSASLRFTNAFTIGAWVNPTILLETTQGSYLQTIVSIFDDTGSPFHSDHLLMGRSYYLGLTNGNRLIFKVSATASAVTYTALISALSLPTNRWSHVAATFGSGALRLYVNVLKTLF